MLTTKDYQVDGLVMGSFPARLLASGWMRKHDPRIKEYEKLFLRYMDGIIHNINHNLTERKLKNNNLNPSFKVTTRGRVHF